MNFAGGSERLVSQQQFPISSSMTGVLLTLQPGGLRELHWHPNADEWQYYIRGRSEIGIFGANGKYRQDEFGPGDVLSSIGASDTTSGKSAARRRKFPRCFQ